MTTPDLLLLDEPFAALDALTRYRMHELVLSLWRAHRPAVLIVTHDVEEAIALADRARSTRPMSRRRRRRRRRAVSTASCPLRFQQPGKPDRRGPRRRHHHEAWLPGRPHRPGFTQPTVAARQLATLDQLLGGRVAVHIITGGADEEMARDGDTKSVKAERYARTDEYLTILRQEWTAALPFDHQGKYYDVKQAFSAVKPENLPVFFGGSSAEAIDVAGRHADVYALWGETLEAVQDTVRQVRRSAARHGRDPGFSLSLRPIVADTEEAAWKRAAEIEEQVRENRVAAGLPISGHRPPNAGSLRLLETASANRQDKRLWTGVAALTGAAGNSTGLVGTPEQIADAMLDYYDIGIDHFLIRGFDPLGDAILYGRELLPVVRRKVAERDRTRLALAG